jgi:dipeptidyl aminopeptidase/acylaminoacyl peptidase
VNAQELRRALLAAAPPDELAAQRRAWGLVRTAFDEREPTPWPRRHARLLIAAAAGIAVFAGVLSPPGRAVISDVRDALGRDRVVVGVPRAKPAVFSLPAEGRLLVTAPTGAWVLEADGSKRRLGNYDEASWSPRAQHVVATTQNQLVAVTPRGEVKWTLARPRVHSARWSPSGFRIAYLSGSTVHVVAGDKTGDRAVGRVAAVPPAWRPVEQHVLAYVTRERELTVLETDANETLWTARARATPVHLEWSGDGSRLLTVVPLSPSRFALTVYDGDGRRLQSLPVPGRFSDAAFAPDDHRIALVRSRGPRSELLIVDGDLVRRQEPVFAGKGRFSDVAWSPGGRWLLLGWESAGQWLFIRSTDVEKVKAVSSLSKQFDPGGTGGGAFPRIEGWCCPR